MNIPRSVKILGVNYEIVQVDYIEKGSERVGEINHPYTRIKLQNDLSNDQKERALMHEVTHGILALLGDWERHNDEEFVSRFSSALHQVMKDNELLFFGRLGLS